jgi:hypothetical protein
VGKAQGSSRQVSPPTYPHAARPVFGRVPGTAKVPSQSSAGAALFSNGGKTGTSPSLAPMRLASPSFLKEGLTMAGSSGLLTAGGQPGARGLSPPSYEPAPMIGLDLGLPSRGLNRLPSLSPTLQGMAGVGNGTGVEGQQGPTIASLLGLSPHLSTMGMAYPKGQCGGYLPSLSGASSLRQAAGSGSTEG